MAARTSRNPRWAQKPKVVRLASGPGPSRGVPNLTEGFVAPPPTMPEARSNANTAPGTVVGSAPGFGNANRAMAGRVLLVPTTIRGAGLHPQRLVVDQLSEVGTEPFQRPY